MKKAGHTLKTNMFFDTIKFTPRNGQNEIIHRANKHRINLRYYLDGSVRNLSLLRLHVSVINVYSISVCKQLISIETKCSMHFVSVGWNFFGWNSWKRGPKGTFAHCRLPLKHSMSEFLICSYLLWVTVKIDRSFILYTLFIY